MSKALLLFGLCAGLAAARTPVVFELFTSEGCSSCPPADRLLAMLDEQQPFPNVDLIVLSEHVDYWNEGGWTDPYSSKVFTERQARYGEHFKLDSVYTPERVIDGKFEGVGGNAASVKADVEKAAQEQKVQLTLSNVTRNGNQIKFHAASADPGVMGKDVTLYIALAQDQVHSEVRHGENAGRSLTHVAVVRSLIPIALPKNGNGAISKDLRLECPAGPSTGGIRLVAFPQVDRTRQIIGAAASRLQ